MLEINDKGIRDLARALDRLGARGERAQFRALSDTRRRILTEANRDIRTEYAIKVAEVKGRLSATPVRDESFTVSAALRPIGANRFGAYSQKGKPGRPKGNRKRARGGVKVRIKKAGPQRFFAGAYIGKGGLIFRRTKQSINATGKDSAGRPRRGRLPVRRIYGPGVGQMLRDGRRLDRLEEFAGRTLRANLRRRLIRASS